MFIYGTYVLVGGEADAKFYLGKIQNLLQAGPLPNNPSNFCRQMINCIPAKNIRFSPEHRDHQANTQDNDGQEKASR